MLRIHAAAMVLLAVAGFAGADGLADVFDVSTATVRWVATGSLAVALILGALVHVPSWRVALTVAGAINIVLGGTLLGLAPSSPDNRGATLFVVIAVAFAIIAMAEFKIRGPRSGTSPTPFSGD